MVMLSTAVPAIDLEDVLRRAETACRTLRQACVRATDVTLEARAQQLHDTTRFVLDACHVAGATARVLGRHADYQPHVLALIVAACRQVAIQCASACESTRELLPLDECAHACEESIASCDELLALLRPLDRLSVVR